MDYYDHMTILAAIDETKRAKQIVPLAHDLASTYNDALIVLHVIPMEDYKEHKESIENIPEFDNISLKQKEDSAARFANQVIKETIEDTAIEVEPRGRVGDIADETLAETINVDPRYLVISGQRRSPTGKAIFGSSAQKILLNADCPVVTKMSG